MSVLLACLLSTALAEESEEEDYPLLEVELADVKIKRQEPIPIPEEMAEIELPRVVCSMRIFIDPKGIPESVTVAGCPEEFHQTVHDSVMEWKFKPLKTPAPDREPARATFVMAVNLDLSATRASQEADEDEELLD